MMKLDDMIEAARLVLVEQSYMDLSNPECSYDLLAFDADSVKVLVDEDEEPLCIAVGDGTHWLGSCFLLHRPPVALFDIIEDLENLDNSKCEVYQEKREDIRAAIREYYSLQLLASSTPALEDLTMNRVHLLKELINEYASQLTGESCLDCCCGSGVGSKVLREMGFDPLAFDNDVALLVRGFHTDRLDPKKTCCIDATDLSFLLDEAEQKSGFDLAFGFMVGEINNFNQNIWDDIVDQIFSVSRCAFLTVGTESEARLLGEWAQDSGKSVTIHENTRDMLYDRWVCIARNSE
jgi:hypothetical protein